MAKKKTLVFLFLGLALLAVLILMVSLPELNLRGGEPLPLDLKAVIPVPGGNVILPGGNLLYWLIRGFAALIMVGLPIYIIYNLFTPQGRRRLLAEVIILVVLLFFLDRLAQSIQNQPKEVPTQSVEAPKDQPSTTDSSGSQTEQFVASTPNWLVWTASIVLALFLTSLIALAFWLYYRRRLRRLSPADRLAKEAERAAVTLQEGGDFKNTIIRCYYQMSKILYSERGIRRDEAMTPTEFVEALEQKGFPSEPIEFLTKIFEDVRYGTKQPLKREEDKAVWYLTVIAEASKNLRPG